MAGSDGQNELSKNTNKQVKDDDTLTITWKITIK